MNILEIAYISTAKDRLLCYFSTGSILKLLVLSTKKQTGRQKIMKDSYRRMVSLKSQPLIWFLLLFLLCLVSPQSRAGDPSTIHFGVLSIAQPSRVYAKWQPLADYMSVKLGKPVEIVVPRGFGKMKKTIEKGEVDFFYINSYVFYRLIKAGKAIPVAQMENIAGNTTSRSEIFVRKDSRINSVEDLKGKSVAFISPMGAGGYMAPRAYLYEAGLESGKDYTELFTKNLSNSIHGVLLGDYDAATMCGVNYKLMSHKIKTGDLKVIAISDEYPENLIAARSDLSPELIARFRRYLLALDETPDGNQLLVDMNSMKIKKFVNYDESMNDSTQKLLDVGHL
jgi:phosphonate transport system substrate-binding protein